MLRLGRVESAGGDHGILRRPEGAAEGEDGTRDAGVGTGSLHDLETDLGEQLGQAWAHADVVAHGPVELGVAAVLEFELGVGRAGAGAVEVGVDEVEEASWRQEICQMGDDRRRGVTGVDQHVADHDAVPRLRRQTSGLARAGDDLGPRHLGGVEFSACSRPSGGVGFDADGPAVPAHEPSQLHQHRSGPAADVGDPGPENHAGPGPSLGLVETGCCGHLPVPNALRLVEP